VNGSALHEHSPVRLKFWLSEMMLALALVGRCR
jgi:hypothetical protein